MLWSSIQAATLARAAALVAGPMCPERVVVGYPIDNPLAMLMFECPASRHRNGVSQDIGMSGLSRVWPAVAVGGVGCCRWALAPGNAARAGGV